MLLPLLLLARPSITLLHRALLQVADEVRVPPEPATPRRLPGRARNAAALAPVLRRRVVCGTRLESDRRIRIEMGGDALHRGRDVRLLLLHCTSALAGGSERCLVVH